MINTPQASEGRDDALEAAIDRVGRDRAFAVARANGWTYGSPPKFVWWEIVYLLEKPND